MQQEGSEGGGREGGRGGRGGRVMVTHSRKAQFQHDLDDRGYSNEILNGRHDGVPCCFRCMGVIIDGTGRVVVVGEGGG